MRLIAALDALQRVRPAGAHADRKPACLSGGGSQRAERGRGRLGRAALKRQQAAFDCGVQIVKFLLDAEGFGYGGGDADIAQRVIQTVAFAVFEVFFQHGITADAVGRVRECLSAPMGFGGSKEGAGCT